MEQQAVKIIVEYVATTPQEVRAVSAALNNIAEQGVYVSILSRKGRTALDDALWDRVNAHLMATAHSRKGYDRA